MRLLRPDRVFIVPDSKDSIKGFLYVPEGKSERSGVPYLPQDIIHIKLPNPFDPLEGLGYGLSPVSPAARSADVDNIVTRYLKLFFQKGTMMSNVLKFDDPLDLDTVAEVKARWAQQYGGWENWAEVGVLDRGGEVQRLGLTFEEMGFEAIDERNESRILGPFGVPPILLGTRTGLMRSTYSNYEEARRAFWEDTFLAELQLFETELDYYLTGTTPEFVRFDTSQVPALRKDITQQIEGAYKMWTMGVPAEKAFVTVGLDVGQIPGGQQGYLPISVTPVGSKPPAALPAGGGQKPPSDNPPPDDGSGKPDATEDEEQRKAIIRPFRQKGYLTKPNIDSGMG
jgi:HK97 family phage portal protein